MSRVKMKLGMGANKSDLSEPIPEMQVLASSVALYPDNKSCVNWVQPSSAQTAAII